MRSKASIAFSILAFAAGAAAAQVYKWVDENGRTQYGSQPPAGVKATPLNVPAPGPDATSSGPATASQPDWKQKDLDFQRRKIEREKKEADASKKEDRASRLPKQCAYAREEVEYLERQSPIYDFDKQGNKVYLDDTERSKRMAQARAFIADSCR